MSQPTLPTAEPLPAPRSGTLDRLREAVHQLAQAERLQRALFAIADLAGADLSMRAMLEQLHAIVGTLMYARNLFMALHDPDADTLEFIYFVDEASVDIPTLDVPIPMADMHQSLTWHLVRGGKTLRGSMQALAQQMDGQLKALGAYAPDWLGVPLLDGTQVRGVLVVQSYDQPGRYGPDDQHLLEFVASHVLTALQRKQARQDLERAVTVGTAELARINQALHAEVARRQRGERLQAALYRIAERANDLGPVEDFYRAVHHSMGHHAGDAVLREIGRRLSSVLRAPDMVARVGGDEFAVLVADAPAADPAVRIARRMLEVLDAPMLVEGKQLFASASIGISLCDRAQPTATDLLRNADTAMYRAKVNGRRRYELYDEHLHSDALRVLDLENALWVAVKERQFEPYFQPIVSLLDGRVLGYEALARWHHPVQGLLAPGAFVHVAEDSGSMEAIDWQIFEQACTAMAQMTDFAGYLSVNVAPRHFRNPVFCDRMLQLLADTGLPPQRLCLEITEGALIEDPEHTSTVLHALRSHGMALALDDFGTGYSSLGYLHRLPLLTLKIDRSFVDPLGGDGAGEEGNEGDNPGSHPSSTGARANPSAAVVRAVLALAGSLGLNVVAEGIETPEQQSALLALGCTQGQGYLFGRPAPLRPTILMG